MALYDSAGHAVQTNDEGFMVDTNQWSTAVGEAIASELGVALTPRHWEVLNFAREDYASKGSSPGLRRISANANVPIKDIYKLFPKGPGKLVAKIAGLPKPKSCL